jgi:hypothetical protein
MNDGLLQAGQILCVDFRSLQVAHCATASVIGVRCPARARAETARIGATPILRARHIAQRATPRMASATASASVLIADTIDAIATGLQLDHGLGSVNDGLFRLRVCRPLFQERVAATAASRADPRGSLAAASRRRRAQRRASCRATRGVPAVQTSAPGTGGSRGVVGGADLAELLEHRVMVLWRDADARVRHRDLRGPVEVLRRRSNGRPGRQRVDSRRGE